MSFISPMLRLFRLSSVLLAFGLLALACSSTSSSNTGSGGTSAGGSGGSGGSAASCKTCLTSPECGAGQLCGQFAGDAYCAPDCSNGQTCASGSACTTVSSSEGAQIQICIPITNPCGNGGSGGTSGSGGSAGASGGSGGSSADTCGTLVGPNVSSCCSSCGAGKTCQANGCYGGWWCNSQTCKCQAPPASCGQGTGGTTGSGGTTGAGGTTGSGGGGGNGGSVTGISGGKLDTLSFAIVGDTRPPTDDDTAGYPTAVITKIWQDVQAQNPRPAFAVSTGDYMFAKAFGSQSGPQLDLYLGARKAFSNIVFPAMGNHECTGAVDSNCGPSTANGITNNYTTFMSKMLTPLGVNEPYYAVTLGSTTNAWTAKLVFIAANAWNASQSTWLSGVLAQPTTYTFVVRHEGTTATTAPGTTPSDQIIAQYPYTLLIVGHTHTYEYFKSEKQVVVGNGGAPLSGNVNYGYVIGRQRADGSILFTEYDYATNAANANFAVKADGSPAP